ncbi:MAG: VTT domain-containing protein [Candidatus Lambdaproteobacteria bacterium]|nr:VTT domain-containing protein [Candidatus Lambdaproteobacteria bacterium]
MRSRRLLRVVVLLVLAAGIALVIANRGAFALPRLEATLENLGPWAHVAYVAFWIVAPVLFIPGGPITLAGGALFGFALGTLYTILGATAGATLAFLAGRYLAREWVERRVSGMLARIKEGVEGEGWRFVAFVRLVPLFPFNALNYALGLTRIPLRTYVLTSLVCMLPGTAGYAYLGAFGRDALTGGANLVQKGLLALGVFAALVFLPLFLRRLRAGRSGAAAQPVAETLPPERLISPAALQARLGMPAGVLVLDVRSAEEFTGPLGHIAGSRLIPIDELTARLGELEPVRGRPIALV